jgi:hypothetical protein
VGLMAEVRSPSSSLHTNVLTLTPPRCNPSAPRPRSSWGPSRPVSAPCRARRAVFCVER